MSNDILKTPDKFLEEINSAPRYAKGEDGMFLFAKHLNYRLTQNRAIVSFLNKYSSLDEQKINELNLINSYYDFLYKHDAMDLQNPLNCTAEEYQWFVSLCEELKSLGWI